MNETMKSFTGMSASLSMILFISICIIGITFLYWVCRSGDSDVRNIPTSRLLGGFAFLFVWFVALMLSGFSWADASVKGDAREFLSELGAEPGDLIRLPAGENHQERWVTVCRLVPGGTHCVSDGTKVIPATRRRLCIRSDPSDIQVLKPENPEFVAATKAFLLQAAGIRTNE